MKHTAMLSPMEVKKNGTLDGQGKLSHTCFLEWMRRECFNNTTTFCAPYNFSKEMSKGVNFNSY